MSKHIYTDPTGGGDDITLEVPAWVEPPESIRVRDLNFERHTFELNDDDWTDEDDEDDLNDHPTFGAG